MSPKVIRHLEDVLATRALSSIEELADARGIFITRDVRTLIYAACTASSSAAFAQAAVLAEAGKFDGAEVQKSLKQIVLEDRETYPQLKAKRSRKG